MFFERLEPFRVRLLVEGKMMLATLLIHQCQPIRNNIGCLDLKKMILESTKCIWIKIKHPLVNIIQRHPTNLSINFIWKKYMSTWTLGRMLKNEHKISKSLTIAQLLGWEGTKFKRLGKAHWKSFKGRVRCIPWTYTINIEIKGTIRDMTHKGILIFSSTIRGDVIDEWYFKTSSLTHSKPVMNGENEAFRHHNDAYSSGKP